MSQGGFISLRAALKAPERVRGLILIDSQAGLEDPAAVPAYEEMERIWLEQGPEPVRDVVASIILGPPDGPVDYAPWFAKWDAIDREEMAYPFRCLSGPRRHHRTAGRDQLPGADHPRHRRRGDPDGAGRGGPCRARRARRDGQVEGGSHAANLSHPDQANVAIAEFLQSLPLAHRTPIVNPRRPG